MPPWLYLAALSQLEAVLHVGPHKTGSTTLQVAIVENRLIRRLIQADGYLVADDCPGPVPAHTAKNGVNFAFAARNSSGFECAQCRWLVRAAEQAAAAAQHLFYTSEELSLANTHVIAHVSAALRGAGYAVRFVVVYRRLHDRLPSEHREVYPLSGGGVGAYMTLTQYVTMHLHRIDTPSDFAHLCRTLAHHGAVSVLDFRSAVGQPNSSFVTEFVCSQLRAPSTCAALRTTPGLRRTAGAANARSPSLTPIYDIAYGVGAASGVHTIALRAMVFEIRRQLRRNPDLPLPVVCVEPGTRAQLWKLAQSEEGAALRRPLTRAETSELRDDFDRKVDSFCSVDVEALVMEPAWQRPLDAVRAVL